MRCKNCNFENREGVNFCEECGKKIITSEPGLCASCGFQNRKGVKFCEECGTPTGSVTSSKPKKHKIRKEKQPAPTSETEPKVPAPPPQTVVVQVQQEPRRRNVLWIVLGALGAVVICCAAFVILPDPLPDNETILPSAVDQIWENTVNKRNAVVDEGGAAGNLIEAVDNIIPQPVQDVIAGGIGNVVGGKGEPADAAGEEVPIDGGGMAGCDTHQIEACWIMGGKVIQNPYNFDFEEMCLCDGEEYTKEWCEKEGGWWNTDFQECSFINGCYDVNPDNFLEAISRGWFGEGCNNYKKEEEGELIQFCSCPNLENLPNTCGELDQSIHTVSNIGCIEGDVTCKVSFSQKDGFPSDEIRHEDSQQPAHVGVDEQWAGIIKFDNGETINLHDCTRNTFSTQVECAGFDHDRDSESARKGKVYLCRGYCCVYAGEEDLSAIAPVRLLTSNCPDPADLEVDKFRYEKGVILFDFINTGGWEKDEFDGMLVDGLDRDWSGIGCEIDPSDENKMNCRGAGTVRTGKASIRFDPDTFGPGCENEIDIEFPLPRLCPVGQSMCAGSCCSDGHCCTCNGTLGCYQSCNGCS